MATDRIRGWLLAHPGVLSVLFYLMLKLSENQEFVTNGGADAYRGP